MRCGAHNKRGGVCGSWAVKGRTCCRMHGGKTLVGTACPQYRSGRYSAYVPARLRARYEPARVDPDLLSLRGELALVDALLRDLLSRVATGESGPLWVDLKKAHRGFTRTRLAGDVPEMNTALAEMELLIDTSVRDHAAWGEIGALIEQRRRLAESESKRLVALQQMMTQEDALLMMHRLVDIITRHVPDKKALSGIIVDLQQMAGPAHGLPVYGESPEA
jgi:hypothetical protein